MLLSDRDLRAAITSGALRIDPYEPALIQPSSIDVRLNRSFRVFNNHAYTHIDPAQEQPDLTQLVETPDGDPFVLHPGQFTLASTLETVTVGALLAAHLNGKSSLGRLGLMVHSTAGFIDAGFTGHVTLELSNVANLPITLWPGMRIGQLCIFQLTSQAEHPYGTGRLGSRYQHQRGPTPSRAWQGWRTWPTAPCDQCHGHGWVRIKGKVHEALSSYETATQCQACNPDSRIPYTGQPEFYDEPTHHLAHRTPPGVNDPNCPACTKETTR